MKQTRNMHYTPADPQQGNPVVAWTKTTSGPVRPETGKWVPPPSRKVTDLNALRQSYNRPALDYTAFLPITCPIFTDTPKHDVAEVVEHSQANHALALKLFKSLKKRKRVQVLSYEASTTPVELAPPPRRRKPRKPVSKTLPSRYDERIKQLAFDGKKVGEVRYTQSEINDELPCLRCHQPMKVPERHPTFTDTWGSCPHCKQAYVFHLVTSLTP